MRIQFVIEKIMEHKHHNGEPTETHYRTRVHNHTDDKSGIPLYQDVSIEQ